MIRTALLATVLAFTLPYAQPWRTDAPPIQQAGTTVTACDLDPYCTPTTTESTTWESSETSSSAASSESSSVTPPSESNGTSTDDTTTVSTTTTSTEPNSTTNDSLPASSEITAPPPPPSNGPCTSLTVPVETGGAATYQQGACDLTVDVGTPTSSAEASSVEIGTATSSTQPSAGVTPATGTATSGSTPATGTSTTTAVSLAETGSRGLTVFVIVGAFAILIGIGMIVVSRRRGSHR